MSLAYLAPSWFYGYDVILELLFAVITLVVALFAFRVYKKTDQRPVRLFGISFLLISISYIIQSIFNFLIISEMNRQICTMIKLNSIAFFNLLGIYTHMLFMTLGLVILIVMTCKAKKRILWLLLLISILGIFFSSNSLYMFFLFSTIYLAFISFHFIKNYLNKKKTNSLLIALAFLFLLFGNFHFIISVDHALFYAIGHILELAAYMLIATNLYLVLKK